ncbi:MAG TPA: RDD family protein [Solirubrobacteraceae bacterium]|jgi:uncharacterized RDD family membrane protein YckC|nr:RDD family protein [Solirubrobacteraceae bacterium]
MAVVRRIGAAAGGDGPGPGPGPVPGPSPVPGPVTYAGLVTRAIAIVIDTLLIDAAALAAAGAVGLLKSVFEPAHSFRTAAIVAGGALFFVWVAAYFVTFWTTTGQTPGSRVMQIRVARVDGGPIRTGRALVRLTGMVLSLPFLWGYLPILWTVHRRAAFDLFAGTVVTVVPPLVPPGAVRRGSARLGAAGHSSGIEPPSTVP